MKCLPKTRARQPDLTDWAEGLGNSLFAGRQTTFVIERDQRSGAARCTHMTESRVDAEPCASCRRSYRVCNCAWNAQKYSYHAVRAAFRVRTPHLDSPRRHFAWPIEKQPRRMIARTMHARFTSPPSLHVLARGPEDIETHVEDMLHSGLVDMHEPKVRQTLSRVQYCRGMMHDA